MATGPFAQATASRMPWWSLPATEGPTPWSSRCGTGATTGMPRSAQNTAMCSSSSRVSSGNSARYAASSRAVSAGSARASDGTHSQGASRTEA
ncbi:hypothetical protein DMB38_33125 [Streptomyces sp. WAC 06738]|nr:hypothetical protein DMB38_33125 [Streptomyces sp. WAC 06738]